MTQPNEPARDPRHRERAARGRLRALLPFLGPALALAMAAVSWLLSNPYTIRRAFLADVALLAVATGWIRAVRPEVLGPKRTIALTWLACGAFLAAAFLGPLELAPWIASAALAVSYSATMLGRPVQPRLVKRLALVGGGAVANGIVLWVVLLGGYRPLPPAEFAARPLRVHTLLADVPLHDVWEVRLRGGDAELNIEDIGRRLGGALTPPNAAVAALFAARAVLGRVLSLDGQECDDPSASYAHRLSEGDRARSVRTPGENGILYVFEREALLELVNCSVHAFIAVAVESGDDGSRLLIGIYVKQNRAITPYYMALIDPFRRLVVYPVVIEYAERQWVRATKGSPAGT